MSRVPRWKRWLSHFFDFSLESIESDINETLYVLLTQGRLQLCTENAIYSYDDLYLNFRIAFEEIELPKNGAKVLVLGLGLGSILQLLEQIFQKAYFFTAVEIDEAVIHLINKYTLPELASPIQIIQADAFHFVCHGEEKFDLICMDVFLSDVIPDRFQQHFFLEAIKERLSPKGIFLYNCLAAKQEDIERSTAFYEQYFVKVFPNATYIQAELNWILLNDRLALLNHL